MATTAKVTRTNNQTLSTQQRILFACGVIAPVIFIGLFLIEGATRPAYNPLRIPVSSLAIGPQGWTQILNFLVTGSLVTAFAIGLNRAPRPLGGPFWGPVLIGLVGIGLLGAGFFVTDPLNGYPAGTPLIPIERTTHGILHDLFSSPVFTALPAACFVFSRRFSKSGQRGWAIYSFLAGFGMFAVFFLARLGFKQIGSFAELAGLFQRLSLIIGLTWVSLLALHFLRAPEPAAHP